MSVDREITSAYSTQREGEIARLKLQAKFHYSFDEKMFNYALEKIVFVSTALDLGCSIGFTAVSRFSSLGHFKNILGLDIDPRSIEIAKERALQESQEIQWTYSVGSLEESETETLIGDYLQRANPGEEPVVVLLALVLHHLKDPVKTLQMLRRILPSDSQIIIRTVDDGMKLDYPEVQERLNKIIRLTQDGLGASDRLHGRKLNSQLREAGFEDIKFFAESLLSPNMNKEEILELYQIYFIHRRYGILRKIEAGINDKNALKELDQLDKMIQDYETDLHDPSFFFFDVQLGAVAGV